MIIIEDNQVFFDGLGACFSLSDVTKKGKAEIKCLRFVIGRLERGKKISGDDGKGQEKKRVLFPLPIIQRTTGEKF